MPASQIVLSVVSIEVKFQRSKNIYLYSFVCINLKLDIKMSIKVHIKETTVIVHVKGEVKTVYLQAMMEFQSELDFYPVKSCVM